jgi:Protein of unknown function (DUF3106)
MTQRTKFEGCLLVLCLSASLAASSFAQRPDPSDRPPQQAVAAPHQDPSNRPPQQSTPPPASPQQGTPPKQPSGGSHQDQAPVSHDDRPPARSGTANPSSGRNSVHQPVDSNRPPVNRVDPNRPPSNRPTDPNRPPDSQYSRGGQNSYNSYRNNQQRLSPEDRQRVLQNQQRFRQLSPQQQQDLRDREHVWQQMTQQQRDHIKYEVLPTWRTLPPQRKKAIQQRLGVLQNMPEFARNQHLNDPNFTRGMSAEDRAMLRDLSHLHVGGAPDPPTNRPY